MVPQECVIKLIEELVEASSSMFIDGYILPECYEIIIRGRPVEFTEVSGLKQKCNNGMVMSIYYDRIRIRRFSTVLYNNPLTEIEFCDPNLIEKITYELTHINI